MTAFIKTRIIHDPEKGAVRLYFVLTPKRVDLVRLAGFINRAGWEGYFVKDKRFRQAPSGVWFSTWRLCNPSQVAERLLKEAYQRGVDIISGKISSKRVNRRKEFILKFEQLDAKKRDNR